MDKIREEIFYEIQQYREKENHFEGFVKIYVCQRLYDSMKKAVNTEVLVKIDERLKDGWYIGR
jgi:hypothetical protein